MWDFERIAEGRIAEAMARGEFDNLAGAGKPLSLDDDALVAPELRMAYRVLKNAGFVPEELELRKEISQTEALLVDMQEGPAQASAVRRLNFLLAKLGARRGRDGDVVIADPYRSKALRRMTDGEGSCAGKSVGS